MDDHDRESALMWVEVQLYWMQPEKKNIQNEEDCRAVAKWLRNRFDEVIRLLDHQTLSLFVQSGQKCSTPARSPTRRLIEARNATAHVNATI